MNRRSVSAGLALGAILALGACGSHGSGNGSAAANNVSEDPFGATGAPGSDMTDKGVTDGSAGTQDTGGNGSANDSGGAASNDAAANSVNAQ